jgi:orotate phosphoribosyltransferase
VVLIEDVSTTGHQVAGAAKAVEKEGGEVAAIILVIDRGGADPLEAAGYTVESVVSLRPTT